MAMMAPGLRGWRGSAELQAPGIRRGERAHAGGLQALQEAQRAAQPVDHRLARFVVVIAESATARRSSRGRQVAVVVERLDQHHHRAASRRTGACHSACWRRWSCSVGSGGARSARVVSSPSAGPADWRRASRGCRRSRRARCRSPSRRVRWCRAPARRQARPPPLHPRSASAAVHRARRRGRPRWCVRPAARRAPARPRRLPGGGFCSSICLDLLVSSSVDSCSSRIDCCSCGVERQVLPRAGPCRDGFNRRTVSWTRRSCHMRKCSPR